ncbi:MAG TPA: aromatic ring-hydroxylating dioxygenase subunit alpha [Acidimicrobiia bacterium]
MTVWTKPAEGSWTEHYPLGTGRVVLDVTPETYELERKAIFGRAWLNVGRMEQLPKAGSYFTKELAVAKTSIVVVRDHDGTVRAFHNMCRHRGNKLVWQDFPSEETSGTCRQFTCKYHGWRYGLDGTCTFVQQEDEFFDLDKADYGLVPVHCDVWAGFVFVNLDATPRWSLREYLGPLLTPLEGYPFDRMTEWYEFRAVIGSNWKIFLDAFQEYYHVPALHPQQVPPAVRRPDAVFECAHFQLDGPHRVTSSGGARRWTLAPEFMYPIEVATHSGLLGPWDVPDVGEPDGCNPGGVDPWGIDNFQVFPNLEILIYRGWYLLYRYWPTAPGAHVFEGTLCFQPATTVRERVEHEVAAVVFKEFALQDAGTLEGTQMALASGVVREFPLNDQELLVRHFHETVADWVDEYRRGCSGAGW